MTGALDSRRIRVFTIALIFAAAALIARPAFAALREEAPGTARGFAVGVADLFSVEVAAALAQQAQSGSTAADWRSLREAKSRQLSAPQKTGAEAGLAWLEDGHWLQRIRGGWHGFLPTLGGFPSGSGQAFGVLWSKNGVGTRYPSEFTPNLVNLRGSAAFSLRGATTSASSRSAGGASAARRST